MLVHQRVPQVGGTSPIGGLFPGQGMHYSKALWGDDAYEFRPERWEQGAPHRQAVPYCQINP